MTGIPSIIAIAFLFTPSQTAAAEDAPIADENHVVLKGQLFEIYPLDKLESRGVRVKRIPNDQNAAYRYFDAINAMPSAMDDGELTDAFHMAIGGEWPDGELAERLDAYLDQCAPALELTRQAAEMDDYFLPLFGSEYDSIFALLLPTLSDQRQLAKILVVDAHRRARNGDQEGALDNLLTAQRMGNQLGHGSTLIEGLVGVAVGALATDKLADFAESYDIDADLLRQTVTEMDAMSADMPTFEEMLGAEEAVSDNAIDDMITNPYMFSALSDAPAIGAFPIEQSNPGWKRLLGALRRVYLPDRAIKRHTHHYYDLIREGTKPTKDGTPGTILEEDKLFESIPSWDVINQALMPSLAHTYEANLRYRSNYERAKLRIAAEAYAKENGRLPQTLEALAPRYLPRVEADPMTGYDFEYRPERAASGDLVGLEDVTRQSAEELRKKRRTPAILTPRASKWRRYTMNYIEQYHLDDAQRNSAEAVLRDIEARAGAFERSQGAKIRQLIDSGDTESAKTKMGPLDKLFDELTKRLDRLPTAAQRAAAQKNGKQEE
ncbi:MAG: hypothetical protein H6819_01500 [Phycisphaerales bacterium]|nr:hypothetical protein [Phycisphaerales bacterium]MCB9857116.1 hypothetical protein [Phycisphaerales bacterium]MCB9861757.1 hypothetical protein [Phycisphaerales bacterium]